MKLAVGFICYNETSAKYLSDFLASLSAALDFLPRNELAVYAHDNSAKDNNLNRLAIEFFNREQADSGRPAEAPSGQTIVYVGSDGLNLGFSRAYNRLIALAIAQNAEYFLVINPDTLLEPEVIKKLVAALDKDGALASVSPKILRWDFGGAGKTKLIDTCGLVLKAGLSFRDLGQGKLDRGQYDQAPILGPSGAAGLFRLSALKKIREATGCFDERFFMYKEDCDLAYRLFLAGYKSRLVPEAIVYHDRTAASSGEGWWRAIADRREKSREVRAWSFLNQHFLFVKHWKKQNYVNKIIIVFRFLSMFIFSLILEQFLLKQYSHLLTFKKPLTNVK